MTIQNYCTFADVASLSGFRVEDIDFLGDELDLPAYQKLVNMLISASSNLVNRYCNVDTFFTQSVTNELHSMNTIDMYSNTYGVWRQFSYYADYSTDSEIEHASTVFPRQQPVQSVTKVEINMAQTIGAGPQWITLHEWGVEYTDEQGNTQIGKDYQVVERFGTTYIYLIYRYPAYGKNNVRITYTSGYTTDSPVLDNIKIATAMIVNNYLVYKKKMQEVTTIRGAGIRDYAPMFESLTGGRLLTEEVRFILDMYKRQPLDPSMYD